MSDGIPERDIKMWERFDASSSRELRVHSWLMRALAEIRRLQHVEKVLRRIMEERDLKEAALRNLVDEQRRALDDKWR